MSKRKNTRQSGIFDVPLEELMNTSKYDDCYLADRNMIGYMSLTVRDWKDILAWNGQNTTS